MKINISAKDLRERLSEMLNLAAFGRKDIVINRHNKPQAVLIDYDTYEWFMNPRLKFTDEQWEEGFEIIDQIRAKAKPMTKKEFAEFEELVDQVVHEVRREQYKKSGR